MHIITLMCVLARMCVNSRACITCNNIYCIRGRIHLLEKIASHNSSRKIRRVKYELYTFRRLHRNANILALAWLSIITAEAVRAPYQSPGFQSPKTLFNCMICANAVKYHKQALALLHTIVGVCVLHTWYYAHFMSTPYLLQGLISYALASSMRLASKFFNRPKRVIVS